LQGVQGKWKGAGGVLEGAGSGREWKAGEGTHAEGHGSGSELGIRTEGHGTGTLSRR
jgi:hypothetical protein